MNRETRRRLGVDPPPTLPPMVMQPQARATLELVEYTAQTIEAELEDGTGSQRGIMFATPDGSIRVLMQLHGDNATRIGEMLIAFDKQRDERTDSGIVLPSKPDLLIP